MTRNEANVRHNYATFSGAMEPFDIAFHTSATQEGLQMAIDCVGMEGRVVEMSWYGARPVTLHLGGDFRYRWLSARDN